MSRHTSDDIVEHIVRRVAATVDAPVDTIERAVRTSLDEWSTARVRTFVPIFVERSVRSRLGPRGELPTAP